MATGKTVNVCRMRQQKLDAGVKRRLLRFVSAMAVAVPTWLERMITLMRQTVQQQVFMPKTQAKPKPAEPKVQPMAATSEQIFTGPKGGQYVLTASGKKKYLKK